MHNTHSEDLENRIKKYEPITSFKGYMVDTSARILFYVPLIGLWEKFVADFDNMEVLKSRSYAVAVNLVFGRAHGKVRELVSYITKTNDDSSKKIKFWADTLSGFIIGGTSYALVLYLVDVSWKEALVASPFALTYTTFGGWPFGKFNDWYRQKFGMKSVYNKIDSG